MINRVIHFGSPVYLSTNNDQLVVKIKTEKLDSNSETKQTETVLSYPVEDIGVVIFDHPQILISHGILSLLLDSNVAVIVCDKSRHPSGLMLPLSGHHLQQERFTIQIEASEPLKKKMWQQTIKSKIMNQAFLLGKVNIKTKNMIYWAESVRSGDPDNYEGRSAAYYWKNLFTQYVSEFKRDREGMPPNNVLNYGYSILRAMTSRNLVATGLLPTFGIHHHNRYNAFCLADDIMEPYRPFVDGVVLEMISNGVDISELHKDVKAELLRIGDVDVLLNGKRSPLSSALQKTTQSVAQCFSATMRKISYPEWPE